MIASGVMRNVNKLTTSALIRGLILMLYTVFIGYGIRHIFEATQ